MATDGVGALPHNRASSQERNATNKLVSREEARIINMHKQTRTNFAHAVFKTESVIITKQATVYFKCIAQIVC